MNSNGQLPIEFIPKSEVPSLMCVQGGELYFSNMLLEKYGVDPTIQKVRRSQYISRKSKNFEFFSRTLETGERLFFYKCSTIPSPTFVKHNLPSIQECSKHFSLNFQNKVEISSIEANPDAVRIKQSILEGLDRAFRFEFMFYRNEIFSVMSKFLAEKYAVLDHIRVYLSQPDAKTIKLIHTVLQSEEFKYLAFPEELNTFYHYLDRAKEAKDLKMFVLGKYNVKDNARKINDIITELICFYAGHPNSVSHERVLIWVNVMIIAFPNLNGQKKLEIRSINKVIAENPVKILIYRKGDEYVNKVVSAYLHMSKARHPMDQFSMDEWYIDMVCKSSEKRIRKIVIGISDGFSKKFVHRKQTKELKSEVMLNFLHETVKLCRNRIPAELVCDFASYNVCKEMSRIFNYLMMKFPDRFFWSPTSTANSKDIERYWEVIGSYYLKPLVGYVGPAITVERQNSRPAKVITMYLNNPSFLDDETESDRIIDNFMDTFNKKGIHYEKDSPNEMFSKHKAVNAIPLQLVDLAFCFGKKESRILNRSEVVIDGRFFQSFGLGHIFETEELVDIYYYREDGQTEIDQVFVFEKDSFKFLGEFKYYNEDPKAKINRTEESRASYGSKVGLQQKQREAIMEIKGEMLEQITEKTGGVDAGQVANMLINLTVPQLSTSVLHLNPAAKEKVELNPFMLKGYEFKGYEKKKGSKEKAVKPISSVGLLTDTCRDKFAS